MNCKLERLVCWVLAVIMVLWFLSFGMHSIGDMLVICFFGYLLAPIKHPCDYNSYSQWLQDIRHWFSA